MSSKIYEQVSQLTNRPELKVEIKTAIQLAITYYHGLELWDMDMRDVCIDDANKSYDSGKGQVTVDLAALTPKFGQIVGDIYIEGEAHNKVSKCTLNNCTYSIMGTSLVFNHLGTSCRNTLVPFPKVCFSYKSFPEFDSDICDEDSDSWIARMYPEIISRYATEYLHAVTDRRQMRRIPMDEQTLLRLHLGDTE